MAEIKVVSLTAEGDIVRLALEVKPRSRRGTDYPLYIEGDGDSRRVVLYPDNTDKKGRFPLFSGNAVSYKLELMRCGNLAPLGHGRFLFFLGVDHQRLYAPGFEEQIIECCEHSHRFAADKKDHLFLRVKMIWGADEATKEQRELNEAQEYARFREEPLDERKVFFESTSKRLFNDNPRAIYEELRARDLGYTLVWGLANDKTDVGPGGTVSRLYSLDYWHHLATAKYIVSNMNQVRLRKRPGQVVIQSMHGIPLKHMGLLVAKKPETRETMKRVFQQDWDYFVTPCDYMSDILRGESYGYQGEFIEAGYPRNDVLVNNAENQELRARVRAELGVPEGKKVILWAPTWRTKKRFDMSLDLKTMRKVLGDEYVLVLRSHYLECQFVPNSIYNDFVLNGHWYENVNDMLLAVDVLITDYSSIMFDYAILQRPMILYTWDYDAYVGQDRGTYFDLRGEYPELIAMTSDEVIDKIDRVDSLREVIRRFGARFNQYETGHAAATVVDAVFGA